MWISGASGDASERTLKAQVCVREEDAAELLDIFEHGSVELFAYSSIGIARYDGLRYSGSSTCAEYIGKAEDPAMVSLEDAVMAHSRTDLN